MENGEVRRHISPAEIASEEPGVPTPHQAPQARLPVLGREVPKTSGFKSQWELWLSKTKGFWAPRYSSSKICMDLFGLPCSEEASLLPSTASVLVKQLKGHQGHTGRK